MQNAVAIQLRRRGSAGEVVTLEDMTLYNRHNGIGPSSCAALRVIDEGDVTDAITERELVLRLALLVGFRPHEVRMSHQDVVRQTIDQR